jgi:nucleotide-binding universal stress UspA family protein
MYLRMLVGLDGSAGSWQALDRALGIARANQASLVGLYVEMPFSSTPLVGRDVFKQMIARTAQARAKSEGIRLDMRFHKGYPAETIAREATVLDCDLIVLGHTSAAALRRLYSGSVSQLVQTMAPCETMVVDGEDMRILERPRVPLRLAHRPYIQPSH